MQVLSLFERKKRWEAEIECRFSTSNDNSYWEKMKKDKGRKEERKNVMFETDLNGKYT